MKKIGLTLLTAFVGGAMALGAYKVIENKYANNMSLEERQKVYFASNPSPASSLSSAGQVDFTGAAAAVTPAVVYIRTTYSSQGNDQESQLQQMFGDMFGQRARPQGAQMASGSGVIISPDGYIVTNNHVVEKAEKIEITTNDHRNFKAKVIGTDPNTDLALIKIDATDLPIVKLGNSDAVKVGEWVLAVGNPFKLTSTVTAGIVSAKGRGIGIIGTQDDDQDANPFGRTRAQQNAPRLNRGIESFIQTDAAINPGNSGGALVNTAGELVGINSAIASPTGSYAGYSYAIPVNLIKKVVNDLLKYGNVQRAYLGVKYAPSSLIANMSDEQLKDAGIKRDVNGVQVTEVIPNSSASAAGLRAGDVITAVNGVKIPTTSQLSEQVARYKPGDKISLTYLRDNKEVTADNVVLKNLKGNTDLVKVTTLDRLGADLSELDKDDAARLGVNGGVIVNDIGNGILKKQTTMAPGFVILKAGNTPVTSVDDLSNAVEKQKSLKLIGFYPEKGSSVYYYNITTGTGAENL